VIQTTMYP